MMAVESIIDFSEEGQGKCFYTEAFDLQSLGKIQCRRATYIEFNIHTQQWEVTDAENNKILYSHPSRQACIEWEKEHLVPEA